MMARGFKPVGWVAAVATAALGCYMLSLNVASERADLAKVEAQIVAAKQDIRSLQTELGTRGRMAQLEQWNADVLALSAPMTSQFMDDEVKLARFDPTTPTLEQRSEVRLAAADVAPLEPKRIEAPVVEAAAPVPAPVLGGESLVRRASLDISSIKPPQPVTPKVIEAGLVRKISVAANVAPKRIEAGFAREVNVAAKAEPKRIDDGLVREISVAAKVEAGRAKR